MNPSDNLLRYALADEAQTPTLVDERSDKLMYLGFPLNSCTGPDDPKWLIKRVVSIPMEDGSNIRVISFANGVRRYNMRWTQRATLTYNMTAAAPAMTDEELREAVR